MKNFLLILLLFPGLCFAAQPGSNERQAEDAGVRIFYQKTAGQPVWVTSAGRRHLYLLVACLQQAVYLGLDANDYEPVLLHVLVGNSYPMPLPADTLETDKRITKAAIQFFSDVAYGRLDKAPVKYDGLPLMPDTREHIAAKLADYILQDQFPLFMQSIEPVDMEYRAVKVSMANMYALITDTAFKEIPVTSLKADSANGPLLLRLGQVETLDTGAGIRVALLQDRIRKAQHLFNTLDDGVLRERFLRAINVPLSLRLKELANTLNQLRWLQRYKAYAPLVLVNIPSTTLVFYEHEKPVLYSRVITGKKSTPTPTLGSRITEVILFPYWTVPHKIAVRELLPRIKRSRQYLTDNQYEILDKHGHIADPSQISWNQLGSNNFPYVIRQNTGCDNSLGIVKLNFFSPYSVYLHDTPGKGLFMLPQRFFSHGCVRVEEALSLAHLLLPEKAATMQVLEANGSQPDQKPVVFPVPGTVHVLILYNTAWPDASGQVRFYEDVYGKN